MEQRDQGVRLGDRREGGRYFGGEGRTRAEVLEKDVTHLRQAPGQLLVPLPPKYLTPLLLSFNPPP